MDAVMLIGFMLIILFIVSLVISWKFQYRAEGKDERGKQILNTAYTAAFPVFPIGWLLITLYDDFVAAVPFPIYKKLMWILVLLGFIVHGAVIYFLKKRW
ncbi:hypothetical protein ACLIBG_09575 [Virgibacillus sp. W0181]|uniref:hypothetical protein n=1 Tax=Virgibacillus sp. W0181 TaxID=3391581 RepID=UPI003F488CA0